MIKKVIFFALLVLLITSCSKTEQEINKEWEIKTTAEVTKLAEDGDVNAQYELGRRYRKLYDEDGGKESCSMAIKWFKKAAQQGHANAMVMLAGAYHFGIYGMPKNDVEAYRYCSEAAKKGNAYAQLNLGSLYMEGDGVEKDTIEAKKWFKKAVENFKKSAKKGDAGSQNALGSCYQDGTGVEQNYEEAINWYQKAAEQELAAAQYNLGLCYKEGLGVKKNEKEAEKWLQMAAAGGSKEAGQMLEELNQKDEEAQK